MDGWQRLLFRAVTTAVLVSQEASAVSAACSATQLTRKHSFCLVNGTASTSASGVTRDDRPLLVFVHVNKAGGTFIRSFLQFYAGRTGLRYSGDEVHQDVLLSRDLTLQDIRLLHDVDVVNGAWGYCGLVDRPCVYLTHVRDPVEKCMSHYRYFCKLGREGHKMWGASWTSCDLSIGEWFAHCCGHGPGSSLTPLTYKFARTVDRPGAGRGCLHAQQSTPLAAASHNLLSGCVRYIIANNSPNDEIRRVQSLLQQVFPWASLKLPTHFSGDDNKTPKVKGADTDENRQWCEDNILQDKIFFDLAHLHYEESWGAPLQFC